ncbi:MAG: hypothetical protein R3316_01130 [Rhodovibrionaceae bacterium]|nr:hypothetical protein [Rhodovibrionaceae bacterium]
MNAWQAFVDHAGNWMPASQSDGGGTWDTRNRARLDVFERAIRQTGSIEIIGEPTEKRITLRFDCTSVSEFAVSRARAILVESGAENIAFDYYLCGARKERFTDALDASRRLRRLWQISDALLQPPSVVCKASDPDELRRSSDPAIRELACLLDLWDAKAGVLDAEVVPLLRHLDLLDRTLLMERADESRRPVFTFIGEGFTLYGDDWPKYAVGRPVEDQPDPVYGRWAAKTFEVMMASGLPQFEEVAALIRTPKGWPRARQYKCLRLLWHSETGEPVMSSTSMLARDAHVQLVS